MSTPRSVLFVCLHGAAKSVLVAADFTRLAAERGLDLTAEAAGTEPDPRSRPAWWPPCGQKASSSARAGRARSPANDTARADRVVTFGCELGAAAPAGTPVERWDDVPAVSEDLPLARAAIRRHLDRLLDECAATGARR